MSNIQSFSYHNHTNFSDGADSLIDMVRRGKELGFTEMGISDHLIVHKDFPKSKSQVFIQKRPCQHVYIDNFKKVLPVFQKHCEEIRQISKLENIKLYVGFEVDYFTYNGWEEELRYFLKELDYDYLISGNHMMFDEDGLNVFDLNDLKKIYSDTGLYKEYISRHFQAMKSAVESRLFAFLAHIDYARKLGEDICGSDSFKAEKLAVLDALQNTDTAIEISTKGLRKVNDFYPCSWILDEISRRNLSVVISDDAHRVAELGVNFADAEQALIKHKITRRFKL